MTGPADWPETWSGRGRAPGGSGIAQVVVTGGPDGDGTWTLTLADGVVTGVAAGAAEAADVVLTVPAAVAEEIAGGSLAASAAFMQGRMKTAGHNGLVLDVLAAVDGGG
jgi:alkyl sulfatase BDS1-like metallo-beta-lactamase superfamily hydrolase